uniref:Uncharacterized protein n=1 Tax=Lepeophtheirus salmonis TaxID=72036 RepID=A0A0K2SWV1_LEPSM
MTCQCCIESKAWQKSTAIKALYDALLDTDSIANWIFHEISDIVLSLKKKTFCSITSFAFKIGSICLDNTPARILYATFNIVIGLQWFKSVPLPFVSNKTILTLVRGFRNRPDFSMYFPKRKR